MKKIILFILSITLLAGCETLMNTPTKKTEELLAKYQKVDTDIETEINNILLTSNLSTDQQKEYKAILKKQYQNLVYVVKDEKVDGDTAVVTVEIEVYDYKGALDKLNTDYPDNKVKEYGDKKIDYLKSADQKVKYTLEIEFLKKDGKWVIESLSSDEIEKLQGMY